MKRFRILALIFTVLALAVGICACDPTPAPGPGQDTPAQPGQETQNEYVITTDTELSYTLHVGDEVDFTQYFIVEDGNGNRIVVTEAMLDLSRVDLTKAGTFTVTLKIGDASKSAEFTVLAPEPDPGPTAEDTQKVTAALAAITDKTVEETTTLITTADGVTITWTLKTADLPDGISVSGNTITVTARPDADTALNFTVKASLNGAEQTKDVTITVKAKPEEQGPSPEEVANATIAAAKEAVEQGKLGIQTVYTAVNTAGVALPAEYEGATLSWAASNSNYAKIANNKLTIPALPEGADATVTLTVTISCTHGTAQAVNLTITVKAKPGPTAEDVAKVNAALAAIKNQVIEETTTLNTTADGVTLTWTLKTANLPDGITVSGNKITVITRPDADTALNFTVKASLNGAEESKDITITVKAMPGPSAEDMQKVTEALATITNRTIEGTTTLAASVGDVALAWTLKTIDLPNGISVSGNKITVTTRPNTDTAISFTVKASLNGAEESKDVTITVKAMPGPSAEDVQKVEDALATISNRTIEGTTTLAATVGDVTLTWTLKTTLPLGISFSGNMITVTTRPNTDTALNFTVKASLNGAEHSKDVTITVKAKPGPSTEDVQKVTAALAAVESTYEVSETGDYTLPVSTVDGVSFAWAVTSGSYQLTNGNTLYIQTLPAQDETVTLTLTASCGLASSTKSVTVIIKAETVTPPTPEKEGFNPITAPAAGTEYYLGVEFDGAWHYFTGTTANTYYLGISENIADAQKLTLEKSGSGWAIRFGTQYVEVAKGTETHYNAVISDSQTAGKVWVWNTQHSVFTMTVDGTEYFLGTYENTSQNFIYDSISANAIANVNSSTHYPAYLGTYNGTIGGGTSSDLTSVLQQYEDQSKWNFKVAMTETYDGESYTSHYEYQQYDIQYRYEDTYGGEYIDYIHYDYLTGEFTYYADDGYGEYTVYDQDSTEFQEDYFPYTRIVDLTVIGDYAFTLSGGVYVATDPSTVGDYVLGQYEGATWNSFQITISNGKITRLYATQDDGTKQEYIFSDYGAVSFTLPSGGSGTDTPVTPSGPIDKQNYDALTFDDRGLQKQTMDSGYAIGLPSTGTYSALVIPVQFKGDTITNEQMANLRTAFNGTESDTGWESVKTYYEKSSYGNLHLSFDIQDIYEAKNDASYYKTYSSKGYFENGQSYPIGGDTIILEEALKYYEGKLDLTKYDTNGDGFIDAVYLIYSAPVDYDQADFYWAYVTWYYGSTTYDGLDAYYYLFAGFDFLDESTSRDPGSGYNTIGGLKINADTFIHETGHLLGLDDYYDYSDGKGSDEGLGGADMMDYNVGDHDVYSKTMLGWLTPTIVNDTTTVTIKPSVSNASAILIPLDFNNSYFCEYLMVDLYSATGVNALHSKSAQTSYTVLYGGASFGVRIYHVSSSIDNSYSSDYGSFTDYNNSDTKYSLIKLVEANGTKKFSNSNGYAAASDLWQTGGTLSETFPEYTRNDGKTLNFDIEIVSATATKAQIRITFNN